MTYANGIRFREKAGAATNPLSRESGYENHAIAELRRPIMVARMTWECYALAKAQIDGCTCSLCILFDIVETARKITKPKCDLSELQARIQKAGMRLGQALNETTEVNSGERYMPSLGMTPPLFIEAEKNQGEKVSFDVQKFELCEVASGGRILFAYISSNLPDLSWLIGKKICLKSAAKTIEV